jgi:hypothetical protein
VLSSIAQSSGVAQVCQRRVPESMAADGRRRERLKANVGSPRKITKFRGVEKSGPVVNYELARTKALTHALRVEGYDAI